MSTRILILSLSIFIISACGDEKRTNYTTTDDEGNTVMTEESMDIMSDLVDEFNDCRTSSTKNLLDCKYFIAKAICDFYQIDDFYKDGEYVDYHEMHDMIHGQFGTWKVLGDATNQKALETAQEHANNGQATVAISTRDKYGHVAIIVPGHVKPANSWGKINVPDCASFFMVKHLEPFACKPLNYAWSDPSEVILYTRTLD